ncbi:MAG: UTP--glucose-1-phosphate uridylyltransferase [Patescibacteria group bacterium]
MSQSSVRKLIIPVAGIGTRMLPVTKAQPKEMLPVLDKPVIQYIVEEAVKAGIRDVIFVTGASKRAIEDHFDRNEALERVCLESNKEEVCRKIKEVAELANFIFIRQRGPYGTGTPVLNAKDLIGNEPFAVVWGDEIIKCPEGKAHLKQLIDVYERYGDPVVTAIDTDDEGTKKYGVVEGVKISDDLYEVKRLLEKPGPAGTASRVGSIGGYVLTPDVFEIIETMPAVNGRERYLTDAIDLLIKKRPVYGKVIEGTQHDTGNKFNWIKTNIEFALEDPEISQRLKEFLKSVI